MVDFFKNFEDYELPKNREFLRKYFLGKSEVYLLYSMCHGNDNEFVNNTGINISPFWIRTLRHRLERLIYIRDYASNNLDIEMLSKVESGKMKISDINLLYCKIFK
jgi:hypothetical protein